MSKRTSYWNYKKIFKKYKGKHDVFIESGTHTGDSVCDAIDLGFKKIYSVEINKKFYDESVRKINKHYPDAIESGQVTLKCGDSREWIPIYLDMIGNKSALIWSDAHHGSDIPTGVELNAIIAREQNYHTIVIDDMGLHVDESQMDLYCSTINPKYKTEYFNDITTSVQKVYYVK